MMKLFKTLFVVGLLGCSFNAMASDRHTLVVFSPSVNYMNTLTIHNNKEQCETAKTEFEKEFADEKESNSGKTRFFFKCVNIRNSAI